MARRVQVRKSGSRLAALAAAAALFAGCGSGAASAAPSAAGGDGATVSAALSEFKIELGATSALAGPVTFSLTNKGTTVHEFVVFRTDLAADALPLSPDGTEVDEEAAGLTLVDEVEDIATGGSPSLTVTLPAGHYVLICNLPAHYTSGMRAEFTTPAS